MSDSITLSIDKKIATITLNDPKASNAFTADMVKTFAHYISLCDQNEEVQVVIFQGEGKNFSAGANLADKHVRDKSWMVSDGLIGEYFLGIDRIGQSNKIFIAAINGALAGIAGAMMMNCDLAIMADNAYMYQPFIPISLIPDGGTHWHLMHTIGYKKAMSFILTSEKIPAEECVNLGLANRVVPHDKLREEVRALALLISEGPIRAQSATKRVLRAAASESYRENFIRESYEQNGLFRSDDFKEGVTAFFEKRKPVWKNK